MGRTTRWIAGLLLGLSTWGLAHAGNELELVFDANNRTGDASVEVLGELDGVLMLGVGTQSATEHLYKTDGTEEGTELVSDEMRAIGGAMFVGDVMLFSGYTVDDGSELWSTDGTTEGTVMVADLNPGTGSSTPFAVGEFNGEAYFRATDGTNGMELWKSDGTEEGTAMVKDINPGSGNGFNSFVQEFEGYLYFAANDGTDGTELWRTDGTEDGTELVSDINSGSGSSNPGGFAVLDGELYFRADDGVTGAELWKSDGTDAGTVRVADISTGASGVANLTPLGDLLLFQANDGVNGFEPWRSDGTALGTYMLKDIDVVANGNFAFPVRVGDIVFFRGRDSVSNTELWKTDGTEDGTVQVADINPDGSGLVGFAPMIEFDGDLYFAASDGTGSELWKSDGTEDGTVLVKDIHEGGASSPDNFAVYDGALYFVAESAEFGRSLWTTDGTEAGTEQVSSLLQTTEPGALAPLVVADDELIYYAARTLDGIELVVSDGTEAGSVVLTDLGDTFGSVSVSTSIPFNGELYFGARDDTDGDPTGLELYVTDGTVAGTSLASEIPGTTGSDPVFFDIFDGNLLLSMRDEDDGVELHSIDEDGELTLVSDIDPGSDSSYPQRGVEFEGEYYFAARSNVLGSKLWKTDGTDAGTEEVDVTAVTSPRNLTVANDLVMFAGYTSSGRYELYKCDGDSIDLVLELNDSGDGVLTSVPFVVYEDEVYFAGNDGDDGLELWKSGGFSFNTEMVRDIQLNGNGYPQELTVALGELYFTADSGSEGRELWKTDGTEDGTVLVKDIYEGMFSSFPRHLTVFEGELYFAASSEFEGQEVWKTDGTEEGTVMVAEAFEGSLGASIEDIVVMGGNLYMVCATPATDDELHVLVFGAPEITNQTFESTTCEDQDAKFGVVTSGSGVDYQWQEDSGDGFVDLADTNNATLLVESVTGDMDGNLYRCVATNECGSATSEPATLFVPTAPSIESLSIEVDELTVAFSGNVLGDDLSFEWDFGDGGTSDELVVEHEYEENQPVTAELTVTNLCGSASMTIEVQFGGEFLRGDCDGNGIVFPVLDATYLLVYGFNNGDTPPCLDAADCDNSGSIFPIVDALYLLEYGFLGGELPPDPGPTECGPDPDEDAVTCEEPSSGCA